METAPAPGSGWAEVWESTSDATSIHRNGGRGSRATRRRPKDVRQETCAPLGQVFMHTRAHRPDDLRATNCMDDVRSDGAVGSR